MSSSMKHFQIKCPGPLGCSNQNVPLIFNGRGHFQAYPLAVVPILSQMSMISAQSSVVLFSLVAFSGNM